VREVASARAREVGTVRAADAADVVRWAQDEVAACRMERYALTPASLEDVYVDLVGHEQHAQQHAGPQAAGAPGAGVAA
jgi:ABC-2 type transport system ATP-binding protein